MNHMRWSSFTIARNEEKMISDTISCIRNQTIPPTRMHVMDDGSTDSTGSILDGMKDLMVTHGPSHPAQYSEKPFHKRRYNLMCEAAKDMDYVLCMDADTEIPSDYMERITKQMKSDGVVVASGTDVNYPRILPIEPGLVTDVKWIQSYDKLPTFSLARLGAESVADGHPSIVYTTIPLCHKRAFGGKYRKSVWVIRGMNGRMAGLPFPFMMHMAIRKHSFRFFWGYISYRGEMMPKPFRKWFKDYHIQRLKTKFGLRSWMFRRTDVGVFVLPKNYVRTRWNRSGSSSKLA